jgi:hypothetical protein
MLQISLPLTKITEDAEAVVNVLPIWKTNVASGSPSAFKTNVPVNCAVER